MGILMMLAFARRPEVGNRVHVRGRLHRQRTARGVHKRPLLGYRLLETVQVRA